jgi:shikimate dehydrogenase
MKPEISANTKVCGILGDPVEHSLSPAMHNAAFKKVGLDYIYLPFHVTPGNLPGAIDGLKSLGLRGVNVTIPHKVSVIPLLDELEPIAKNIGAVNTIVNNNGYLKGYNTDAAGFLKSLSAKDIEPSGKKVVILGAGGVSRAISFILAEQGADIEILNRGPNIERAQKLSDNLSSNSKNKIRITPLSEINLKQALKRVDILINATSVGMNPDTDNSLVPQELLKPGMVVFDAIYNPVKTKLLKDAEKTGATVVGGLDMLVWQGALAFELWTGIKAPVNTMMNTAASILINTAEI